MHQKIEKLLNNKGDNYIFPFFWQHGEDEKTLREYMAKIDEANMKAVCVESRPHPDFCGTKWWNDMDIILDEARKRNMKVWILDDSHFPTGYANGAVEEAPASLHRQSIWCRMYETQSDQTISIPAEELRTSREHPVSLVEQILNITFEESEEKDIRLGVYAVQYDKENIVDLSSMIDESKDFNWKAPKGKWKVYVLFLSRNQGFHRNYINMLKFPSCRILIDTVYEPHFAHYSKDFGTTIAGFFSDEPELGNGQLYGSENYLGHDIDFPWSDELAQEIEQRLGKDYRKKLVVLWDNELNKEFIASVRYAYMDAVTRLVQKDFSEQISDWCKEHKVEYIGHLIEDNNQHARLGASLGHYFRGLSGQDMAGIDDIGGQVFPQGEDNNESNGIIERNGEFFHYMLGHLGGSLAAIDVRKQGRAMCEIFGAYGWSEGVQLEKYLIDHFAVRGINHFVPHAFSGKEYPDPDCPPHFYAHGHNPQYRHFGELMNYTNRLCELTNGGKHIAPVAVMYHAEAEWMGDCMMSHKVGRLLYDQQINFDYIPWDALWDKTQYAPAFEKGELCINGQKYRMLFMPTTEYVTKQMMDMLVILHDYQIPVAFVDAYPHGIVELGEEQAQNISLFEQFDRIPLEDTVKYAKDHQAYELEIYPSNNRIRFYQYEYDEGSGTLLFVNEGDTVYHGEILKNEAVENIYLYDAWENKVSSVICTENGWKLDLEPRKSIVFVLDDATEGLDSERVSKNGKISFVNDYWLRSICRSIEYPNFKQEKKVILPDRLEEEEPEFSGFVAYENEFFCESDEVLLEIAEAYEGVEVFLNGKSQGIQIVPTYRYHMTNVSGLQQGINHVRIEVATTLERENAMIPNPFGQLEEPISKSGIKSNVDLYRISVCD